LLASQNKNALLLAIHFFETSGHDKSSPYNLLASFARLFACSMRCKRRNKNACWLAGSLRIAIIKLGRMF
ncbi:MAG: hypothetical protein LUC91_03095, partial [Prevotella sp.]|nr:hypothetical protein [Prevotella sp.]